ncbi:MAG TPA: ABC transporter ATP-binding protein [Stellaceae bacterium]|nr:ABC transporter ATP-binding protein [Stellaceae bacterium]
MAFIARYVKRHGAAHALILVAIIGAVAGSVGERYSMKFIVDGMAAASKSQVWTAAGIFFVCVGADNLLWRVGGFVAARCLPRMCADLKLDLFRHLIGHSTRYFNGRLSGALSSRITTAASALYTVANSFMWNVLPPAAATLGALAALGSVQWQMAAVLTLVSAGVAAFIAIAGGRGRALHHDFADRAANVAGEIVDIVANHATVRLFGAGPRETARLASAMDVEAGAQRRSLFYIERLRTVHAAAVWLLSGATLGWASWLWANGTISAGDVVVCAAFTLALLQTSRDLAVALVDMLQYWNRVTEAVETLMVPQDFVDDDKVVRLEPVRGAITLERVSFRHGMGEPVLDDIDLHIRAGQKVGIVGPSGAGKSTLLAVVQRLYPVDRGRILIDGQDVARLSQQSLHRAIAVVPQEVSLFNRSILDNIRYARPDATDAEVMAAARAARCDDFIAALPDGYATRAGERGTLLSAGQKQRIAIARALLADTPVVLLDEATSALDVETEIAVERAIAALAKGRTIVAVAHRLSSIARFERVLFFDHGRIVEDGTPAELMRKGGAFARLWRMQEEELRRADRKAAPHEFGRAAG